MVSPVTNRMLVVPANPQPFRFFAGGKDQGSAPPGRPPGEPPGSSHRGHRFSAQLKAVFDLLSDELEGTQSPSFREAIRSILNAHVEMGSEHSPEKIAGQIRNAALFLFQTASSEMHLIPPAQRLVVVSAIHAAGEMMIKNGGDRRSAADLLRAGAEFSRFVDQDPSPQSGRELFLQDRLLASGQKYLMGGADKGALTADQKESIAANLCRIGIVSGSLNWPKNGFYLPNIIGAVSILFNGIDPEIFTDVEPSPPLSYFEQARSWRPQPVGDAEKILATYLDEGTDSALELSEKMGRRHAHPLILRMRDCLFDAVHDAASRQEVLERLVKITSLSSFSLEGRRITLPAFLKRAMEDAQ